MKIHPILFILFAVFFFSCEEKEINPQLSTDLVKPLSSQRFYVKALVTKRGNIPINDYGFTYYIGNENSQYGSEIKVSLGKTLSSDTFSTNIAVTPSSFYISGNPKFIVKAYITNEKGTLYAKPASVDFLLAQVSQVFPTYGKAGDTITILGTNFDPTITGNAVTFNNASSTVVEATTTKIRVIVPANISVNSYDSYITLKVLNGNKTGDYTTNFSLSPSATSFFPNTGTWNTSITIYGNGLYNAKAYFNDIPYGNYNSQNNSMTISVPSGLTYKSFKLYVEKNGQKIEVPGGVFTMNKLQVSSVSPAKILAGTNITVYGNFFNPYYEYNKLHIGGQMISPYNYGSGYLMFTIPAALSKGEYTTYLSNRLDTIKLPVNLEIIQPEITGISPSSGYLNTRFTITGKNLYNGYSSPYVYFDNYTTSGSLIDSSTVKGNVPGIEPGTYNIYVNVGNVKVKCPEPFTVIAPKLTSITPASGTANTSVIITGEGFGASTNNVYVYFGSLTAYPMAVTNEQINVKVPSGVSSGKWMVKVSINGYTIPTSLTFDVP